VSAGSNAYVSCNNLDRSKPPGERLCHERIEEGETAAQARAIARKRGWLVRVHASGAKPSRPSYGRFDFCPRHRPDKPSGGTDAT
jgi:hypothetical protein